MTIMARWRKHWHARAKQELAPALPDSNAYGRYMTGIDVFQPWLLDPDINNLMCELNAEHSTTLVSSERLWTIKWAFLQTRSLPGEIWEAGVYRGGVARMLRALIMNYDAMNHCALRLFDSFAGLPDPRIGIDFHQRGDFSDTSLSAVRGFVGQDDFIEYRPGWIPDTFHGLDGSIIRLAHVDVDLYQSTLDCLGYIYPKLAPGGIIVLDDYGFVSCPGVRKAVDEFFIDKPDLPLMFPSGQAMVVRTGGAGRPANS
jgi:O-methyltransferase